MNPIQWGLKASYDIDYSKRFPLKGTVAIAM
jgi:hypothetical protein